jgi:2,4-dienoyl-CoA reductase-like NADH-dependent reductase (Old Yellow Enzyme family)
MKTSLFSPFKLKNLHLKNRIVMAPMTRGFSPEGIPASDVAEYYRRRAEGEVGLIISEGTVINRPASANDPNYPHFYGEKALAGWKKVIDDVHAAGGKMAPQLWHEGVVKPSKGWLPPSPFEGPSGLLNETEMGGIEMDDAAVKKTIQAFVAGAVDAKRLGFDAIELHGAHGYLIDQFFWGEMNKRSDEYGGATLKQRSKFAVEIVTRIRKEVGEDFPIILRVSQWKQQKYDAKLANTPKELEDWLVPLAQAGVDIFHCSQRRYWEPEFSGSDLNFAGWTKKITGCSTITVGSVGLSGEFLTAFRGEGASPESIDGLLKMLDRGDFDLVGVGRALLADPHWVEKVKEGRFSELRGFAREDLTRLF